MTNSPHVPRVDDHRDIREPLARYLERHDVRQAAAVDLVDLDIIVPEDDVLTPCRRLRETARIAGKTEY